MSEGAAFPQWLSQQLPAAEAQGSTTSFVKIWDSNGGGNYEFSQASDGKPLEAASWAQYFGAVATVPASATSPFSMGSEPDSFVLAISEDA